MTTAVAETLRAWCATCRRQQIIRCILVLVLCVAMVPLAGACFGLGRVITTTAKLSASDVLRRDFNLGLPTTFEIPTQIPTDIASAVRSIAGAVTSELARITDAPEISISVNMSRASVDVSGFGMPPISRQDSSSAIVLWIIFALQLLVFGLTGWVVMRRIYGLRTLYQNVLVLLLAWITWLLLVLMQFAVTVLCSAATSLSTGSFRTSVYWGSGFTYVSVLLFLSSFQVVLAVLECYYAMEDLHT